MFQIQENVELAPLVTMKVSGKARYFVEVTDTDLLIQAIEWARERSLPIHVLAGGSNVIFALETFEGLVIKINILSIEVHDTELTASAGTPINRLLLAAKAHSLGGLSPFSGLPGTVGGAVRGNAGCYGLETCEVVTSITILNKNLELEALRPEDMRFSYRHSRIKETDEIVISATYSLIPTAAEKLQEEYVTVLKKRLAHQPKGFSSGSFFKNPTPGEIFSGALIEQCGLKGYTEGNMQVSEQHANYLINTGNASIEELLTLKQHVQNSVAEKFNIVLEPEVFIIS